jgi:hypothetical protein
MPDGASVAVSNVSGVTKRQLSMVDMIDESKGLPVGERKFDKNGPGYKKFMEMKKIVQARARGQSVKDEALDSQTNFGDSDD